MIIEDTLVLAFPFLGLLGILLALFYYRQLLQFPEGNEILAELASRIHRGAMIFLSREYRRIAVCVVVAALIIFFWPQLGLEPALALISGAAFSMAAGWLGMRAATRGGCRTTQAALDGGEARAFQVAFLGGSVMGMAVISLGFGGLAVLLWRFLQDDAAHHVTSMNAFALGASCVALFARVGGGIFTKGADVGADLAGKVEASIPEDDPRNPGVIADNVGDCVGDTAGMGADLFESYVSALVAATAIAAGLSNRDWVLFPFVIAALGILSSVAGLSLAHTLSRFHKRFSMQLVSAISSLVFLGLSAGAEWALLEELRLFWAVTAGVICGSVIGFSSVYYTAGRPIRQIAEAAQQGAGPNVIIGLAVGLRSVLVPVAALCAAIAAAYAVEGLFGIALAAVGMLGTAGVIMTADAYGPIADNAGGLAEMSGAPGHVREITDSLDAAGNTTAAIGKGFAIGSAALTSLALFSAYHATVSRAGSGPLDLSLTNDRVMIGLLLGVAAPYGFAAATIQAVGRVAQRIVMEIRRQFLEIPGLLEGNAEPETERCVAIATDVALKAMLLPGIGALLAPVVVGLLLGPAALGGLLAGTMASGVIMGIYMSNGGGAWDNAKKWIEAGHFGGKGSPAHQAAVIGDTIGDPFKDTAGPSMNILIKLMSVIALFLAPFLAS